MAWQPTHSLCTAYMLWAIGGWLGLHHFYLGRHTQGIIWCVTPLLALIHPLVFVFNGFCVGRKKNKEKKNQQQGQNHPTPPRVGVELVKVPFLYVLSRSEYWSLSPRAPSGPRFLVCTLEKF